MQMHLPWLGRRFAPLVIGVLICVCLVPALAEARLPQARPEEVGMNSERLRAIDEIVAQGLDQQRMPGCVVLIARRGKVVLLKAYGSRSLQPEKVPMTCDTVFDLASLTKPIATATSVMLLVERGKLRLDDPVAEYWPEFGQHGKDQITIEHLLTHQGGLIPDNALSDYNDGMDRALQQICALRPTAKPGEKFIYSDVGFIVLAEVVRRVSGEDIRQFARTNLFQPLGMSETDYLPNEALCSRAAPTEQRDDRWLQGEVHDPRAAELGGIAGHAGLFSTAEDLAVYAQMLLGNGKYNDVRVLAETTVREMTKPRTVPRGIRSLGWDMRTGYSSNRGEGFSPGAFGHGGFTGTAMWIDPGLELTVIFLSNRVHPNGKGNVNSLAGQIGTVAASAIEDRAPAGTVPPESAAAERYHTLTGIDVLQRDGFALLKGKRVGLITNHTGINRQGVSTAKLLSEAEGVKLVALFSPEHGIAGQLDVPRIDDSQDPELGLRIYSLYGQTRRPSKESLQSIDVLVFDIQDIGTRFYTYISTLGYAMEAAAEAGVQVVVLDRPNPINGVDLAGPVLDAGSESFVGYHRVPVRHGMTVGELAQLFNAERKIGANLHVVRVENWQRGEFFDATGLTWINPSPNMRSLTAALLYPGVGLLETTNLSVGRGTDSPFEVVGAPWLDRQQVAVTLNRAGLPGVSFVPIRFTPTDSKFKGKPCGGVRILVTDRASFLPLRTGIEIAVVLHRLYREQWDLSAYPRLLASEKVLQAIKEGKTTAEIEALYEPEAAEFRRRREPFLLYR